MPMPEWLRLRRAEAVPADQAAQWTKCPKCGSMIYRPDLAANAWVCPTCSHNFRMHAFDRIAMLVDSDFGEIGGEQGCEFGFAAALVRERQQIDHQAAC